MAVKVQVPFSEKLKGVAGIFGVHLNESPRYTLIETKGDLEIREYQSFVTAEIEIHADYETASKTAFLTLADYIFGGNSTKTELEMTTPIFQEGLHDNMSWKTAFVLPEKYSISTVPKPVDKNIVLRQYPRIMMAALTYSGINSEEKITEKIREIYRDLAMTAYKPVASAICAQYDGPSTIPFLRRNEILVPVSTKEWSS